MGFIKIMLVRFLDQFKALGITAIFTSLTFGDTEEASTIAMSSLMDVWLLVRNLETSGERARGLYVSKARGIAHSNQIREFLLTNQGIQLEDVALNKEGHILTGSARMAFAMEKENELNKQNAEMLRRRNLLKNKREALDAKISALREDYEQERHFLEFELKQENTTLESENKKLDELIDQRNLPSNGLPS